MRDENLSLSAAATAVHMDSRTLRQYLEAFDALELSGTKRYRAGHLKDPPLLQAFLTMGSDGRARSIEIAISDPGTLSELGAYWNMLGRYAGASTAQARREAEASLDRYTAKSVVDVFGKHWLYVTDRQAIDEWLRAGLDVSEPIQSP
jgi:hypothetical protein